MIDSSNCGVEDAERAAGYVLVAGDLLALTRAPHLAHLVPSFGFFIWFLHLERSSGYLVSFVWCLHFGSFRAAAENEFWPNLARPWENGRSTTKDNVLPAMCRPHASVTMCASVFGDQTQRRVTPMNRTLFKRSLIFIL